MMMPSDTTDKTRLPSRGGVYFVFIPAAVLVNILAMGVLNHQPKGVFGAIKWIAEWLRGGPQPEVVTWPAWGYALLLATIPNHTALVTLQICLGVLAVATLNGKLWSELPEHRPLVMAMLLLAIPWYSLQAELYPTALSGSLTLFALLCLHRSLTMNELLWAVIAGILAGLAQNFRTEFVLLPLFLGACMFILRGFGVVKLTSLKPLAFFIITALILQLPWAMFYHAQTGRFSLTESNLGHVLYVSLGSDPDNPWDIKGDDESAGQAVLDAGYDYSSLSEQGNKLLLHIVAENVRAHPYALAKRTLQQMKYTVLAPFHWGEPRLNVQDQLELDVLREQLKSSLGVKINIRELESYRSRGLLQKARANKSAVLALMYQLCTVGIGCVVLLLSMGGMLLVLLRPTFRPLSLLLVLLGCTACYKLIQDVLIGYQINYLSNVYPMFIPFAAITISSIRKSVSAPRPPFLKSS